jgi:hypothetical protein
MNREGIALAADSAETVFGRKIFPSAEKLFAMAGNQPVGVMIYGDADISGIPWETIIKRYREKLQNTRFPNLAGYANNFIDFIQKNEDELIPGVSQEMYLEKLVTECFESLVEDIMKEMKVFFAHKEQCKGDHLEKIIEDRLNAYLTAIDSVGLYQSMPPEHPDKIREIFSKNKERYCEVFENLPIQNNWEKIEKIAISLFTHDIRKIQNSGIDFFDEYQPMHSSGIVIAGFGDKENFPSTKTYDVEGMLFNHLKYVPLEDKSKTITVNHGAEIIPFAQTDMVDQFLWGIDGELDLHLILQAQKAFADICRKTIGNDRKIPDDEKLRILRKFSKKYSQFNDSCMKTSFDFQFERHYYPTIRVLEVLPKDELAGMAETLVNLTSFKRRVSTSRETVGGPIDVAVISRGDGFVWIKRKRYFSKELNAKIY